MSCFKIDFGRGTRFAKMVGQVRVGRSKFRQTTKYKGFTKIPVLTERYGKYGQIGPYNLKNNQDEILENVWQFSKVYSYVPAVSVPYSTGDKTIVWTWPAEVHLDEQGNPNENYWRWREAGKNNPQPVRFPVGSRNKHTVSYSLQYEAPPSETNPRLNYIQSRKAIYVPIYEQAVAQHPLFLDLWIRLQGGENLLILDVDGPHQESLNYYREWYNVPENFIEGDTVLATDENLDILLNDPKHPYGHGYVLAKTLQHYQLNQRTLAEVQSLIDGGFLINYSLEPELGLRIDPQRTLLRAEDHQHNFHWILTSN